jgi:hypothetical protein
LTPLVLSPCVISSNLNSLAKLSVKSLHFPVLKTVSLLSAAQLTHRSVHPLQSVWLYISDPNFVTRGSTVHVSSGRVGKVLFCVAVNGIAICITLRNGYSSAPVLPTFKREISSHQWKFHWKSTEF